MKKLIIGIMLLTTSMFGTIGGLKEEEVISNFIDANGGLPLKVDKYMMQIDMFTQLSHIVNHKFLYKKASLNPINRHFLI